MHEIVHAYARVCMYMYMELFFHCRTSLIAGATALIGKSGSAEWTTQTQTTPPASFHRYRLSVFPAGLAKRGGGGVKGGGVPIPPINRDTACTC